MLTDQNSVAITATEQIPSLYQDIQDSIRQYNCFLEVLDHAKHNNECLASIVSEFVRSCDTLESYENLLAFSTTQHVKDAEIFPRVLKQLRDLRVARNNSSIIADSCHNILATIGGAERELILCLKKDFIFRNQMSIERRGMLIKLLSKLESLVATYLKKKKDFEEHWGFFLDPADTEHFNEKALSSMLSPQHHLTALFQTKFGAVPSPSSYTITLNKKCSFFVLRYGPRELRYRVFRGLHQIGALDEKQSAFSPIAHTLEHVLKRRHKISRLWGHRSTLELRQQINPISVPFTHCLSYYKVLLPALYHTTSNKLSVVKRFALECDGVQDFAPWDLQYYKPLWVKSQLEQEPLLKISTVFEIIDQQLESFFKLSLRKTCPPEFIAGTTGLTFELFHKTTLESFGLIHCDIFHRADKSASAQKSFFIDRTGPRTPPCAIISFSFREYEEQKLHFDDLLKLSGEIARAFSTLIWRTQLTHAALLKNIFPDIKLFLALFVQSWFLQADLLSHYSPELSRTTIHHLIATHELKSALDLLSALKIAYFDSVVHSEKYLTLLKNDTRQYGPSEVWQRIIENYNLYEENPLCLSDETPLTHSVMFSKAYHKHSHIVAHMYYAQTLERIADFPHPSEAGALLYDCLFKGHPGQMALRIQRNFFQSALRPSYLIAQHAQEKTSSPTESLIFSRPAAHSYDSVSSNPSP